MLSPSLPPVPNLKSWGALLPGKVVSNRVERVSGERSKSTIYRVIAAGEDRSNVIAKLCPPETARIERLFYEQVLPHLNLTAPQYYGAVDAGGGFFWILMEDVGSQRFSPLCREQRVLAAQWLARFHTGAGEVLAPEVLPDRGPNHYREHLQTGREYMARSLTNPILTASDRKLIQAVVRQCDRLEAGWQAVEELCHAMPQTVVHGDFRPKNAYVVGAGETIRLCPMDWETAGWGVAAVDLAPARHVLSVHIVDLPAYGEMVRAHWPHLDRAALRRQSRLGMVLRRLAAIAWASLSLSDSWPQKAVGCLEVYHQELSRALRRPPWKDRG